MDMSNETMKSSKTVVVREHRLQGIRLNRREVWAYCTAREGQQNTVEPSTPAVGQILNRQYASLHRSTDWTRWESSQSSSLGPSDAPTLQVPPPALKEVRYAPALRKTRGRGVPLPIPSLRGGRSLGPQPHRQVVLLSNDRVREDGNNDAEKEADHHPRRGG